MCEVQTPRSSYYLALFWSSNLTATCSCPAFLTAFRPLTTASPHTSHYFLSPSKGWGKRYLQCTVMGWFPDCCCCFCTAAMMLIMPFPSLGMPTSGQPWKWNCRICRLLFSFGGRGNQRGRGTLAFPVGEAPPPSRLTLVLVTRRSLTV